MRYALDGSEPTSLSQQLNYKLVIEDENNTLSTKWNDYTMLTLHNKEELNRNIPFSKLHTMDFSSGMAGKGTKGSGIPGCGCP